MDELEKRLRDDADRIRVQASDTLQKRIDASLNAERQMHRVYTPKPAPPASLWWISSLTGLAAAIAVIAVLNWNRPVAPEPTESFAAVPAEPPATEVWEWAGDLQLNVESAELTQPLEQELQNLQSDMEKARRNVERDMKLSF